MKLTSVLSSILRMIDIAAIVFIYCTLERSFGMSFSLKIIIPLSILIYTHEITLKLLLSKNNKDAKPGPKEDKTGDGSLS